MTILGLESFKTTLKILLNYLKLHLKLIIVPCIAGQTEACLACICEAATECDFDVGCSFSRGVHCGPFAISWAFWKDADLPKLLMENHGGYYIIKHELL